MRFFKNMWKFVWQDLSSTERNIVLISMTLGASILLITLSIEENDGFILSLATNLLFVPFGYLFARIMDMKREEEKEFQSQVNEVKRLFRQMKSRIQSEAIRAAEELTALGVLKIGLETIDLNDANLEKSFFQSANLPNLQASNANFHNSEFHGCQFTRGWFWGANLSESKFIGTNLSNACLIEVDANKSIFVWSDLTESDLSRSNCTSASFYQAKFSESRI